MNKILFGMFILLLSAQTVIAQDTYEQWKKKQLQEYQQFKDARDKEFLKMLDDTWKAINSTKARDTYEEPKPTELPKVEKPVVRQDKPKDEPMVEDIELPDVDLDLREQPEMDVPEPKPVAAKGYSELSLSFYEVPVAFSYPDKFKGSLGRKIDKNSISNFWALMSAANYDPLLEQAAALKEELSLNDWGYALLLYRMGQEIYGPTSNESVLFTWFMMTKYGHDIKIGYDQDGVYLLVPTTKQVYNTRFFRIKGEKYYGLTLDNTGKVPSSIFTYEGSYPEAKKKMDLNIDLSPAVAKNLLSKEFGFTYNGIDYEVPVRVNRNIIAFYELYPLTELDVYHHASMSAEARTSLVKGLAPAIKGKSETEAVNIILRFVQTAFEYQTDQEQFGREKYLLPEETLYYPYSDCDDRSIMFSTLVRELTGLKVIGVRYPKHLAVAVQFTRDPGGDFIMHEGKKYTIADPTYVNANIGMTMPQYKNQKPEVLPL